MKNLSTWRLWRFLIGIALCAPWPVLAQMDCAALPKWIALNDQLQLNQQHVFCGEWHNNRPKGFHARPGGDTPAAIAHLKLQSKPNAAGIYTVRWTYKNHPQQEKFSSMFPDQCTAAQIIQSIAFAATHGKLQCPSGSPNWAQCGHNGPADDSLSSGQYCSFNGTRFTIAFAPPIAGKINTAFPIFE